MLIIWFCLKLLMEETVSAFCCFQVERHQHSKSCTPLKASLSWWFIRLKSGMKYKNISRKEVPFLLQHRWKKLFITCCSCFTVEVLPQKNLFLLLTQLDQLEPNFQSVEDLREPLEILKTECKLCTCMACILALHM